MEITRATSAWGAYIDDRLVGVLLADMGDARKTYKSFWRSAFFKLAEFVINLGYKSAQSAYDGANNEMFAAYKQSAKPDGEINFFAVEPTITGKGIGTLLLSELEKKEKGKTVYLFTDTGSTYQFYSRRGFDEVGKKDILLSINDNDVHLSCLLFSKRL